MSESITHPQPAVMTSLQRGHTTLPQSKEREKDMTTVLLANNIHCASCVASIKGILESLASVRDVDVSIATQEVRIHHTPDVEVSNLVAVLFDAAFEVYQATTFTGQESSNTDTKVSFRPSCNSGVDSRPWSPQGTRASGEQFNFKNRKHIQYCDACKAEDQAWLQGCLQDPKGVEFNLPNPFAHRKEESTVSVLAESNPSVTLGGSERFNAYISIAGMSCSSCVNTITDSVRDLDFVITVNVSLLTNSAELTYRGPKANIDKVAREIEDIGFEVSIREVKPMSRSPDPIQMEHIADIGIGGMTCGSCVVAITQGLEELPFLKSVSIDLLSHSGKVIFEGEQNLDRVIEKVEDLGYDATVVECRPSVALKLKVESEVPTRTIMVQVDGMYCHHCPEKILRSLQALSVMVERRLSLEDPIITLSYKPRSPSLTIRDIINVINSADPAFKASVFRPPTIEDRSRTIQVYERRRLLTRLIFVLVVAIPTFLIGIVFMSLVPPNNRVRSFLEQPLGIGAVSRTEWSLFLMATSVMFYGADVFHQRAVKEVRALWRPGSKVPILRRFYRFGSMNLLVSAGSTVAYLSSLGILIAGAAENAPASDPTSTYFDSVVFLTLFILAGRFLEAYSKAKAGDAVTAIGQLRSREALLVTDVVTEHPPGTVDPDGARTISRISVDLLEVGDTVTIPHGASPPADGVTTDYGPHEFNESSLTGESKPVTKSIGDPIYTGSVNIGQPVSMRITELWGTSLLDQIIAIVREGQSKRAPLERIAGIVTAYFVPCITLIAILTFSLWFALGQSGVLPPNYLGSSRGGWAPWSLQFAIAVFVVACPCGLALAAPTALFVGTGLAAKRGILVRGGGEAVQEASRIDAIVFDKTGTLTEGQALKVSDYEVLVHDSKVEQVAWALAYTLENSSNHPIARAISDFCSTRSSAATVISSSDIAEISGQGMKGVFTISFRSSQPDQKEEQVKYEAVIGNERLLQALTSPIPDAYFLSGLLSRYQSSGKSIAILSLREVSDAAEIQPFFPMIVFATTDPIRPESVETISRLQKSHVEVYMCTGDNRTTAHAVAGLLGLPHTNVIANAMPNEKAEFINKLKEGSMTGSFEPGHEGKTRRRVVAFVGDGTNDSPALAAADVSIAMASGTDVAINSASFILLNSNLNTILDLVALSRQVFNRVKMNFCWATIYNLVLVPVAAGVFFPVATTSIQSMIAGEVTTVTTHFRLSPVWASLAMALSSVSVVLSSLALRIDGSTLKKRLTFKRDRTSFP